MVRGAAMVSLNYHHLLYFWVVARTGSVAAACEELRLAQPTISGQVRALEGALGGKLFTRGGRGLVLTDLGRVVFRYADQIFSLGQELIDRLGGQGVGRPMELRVGVVDVVPKAVAYRLLAPALRLGESVRIVCHEDKRARLLVELSAHGLDLVLSDAPIAEIAPVPVFNHLLGECAVAFFGTAPLAATYRRGFPRSLDGAPMLLPTEGAMLRRSVDRWFDGLGIRPRVVSEFEDSALLETFGEAGVGLFPAPAAIASEIQRQHRVRIVRKVEDVREHFYAISATRRLRHPGVAAILDGARQGMIE